MGVHSGLVYRMADINANMNVAGGGINIAQRVMDCGEDGHILLSKRVADDLGQLGRWARHLHDLGQAEVKHGVLVQVYNLYTDEVGNPEVPTKLRRPEARKRLSKRPLVIAASVLLLAAISFGGFLILKSARAPTRTLSYNLTVQKMVKDLKANDYQPMGAPFDSTGQEIYGNGWEFRLNITPAEAGSLYLLNEGAGANGATVYNVLFPTPANNNGVAQLRRGRKCRLVSISSTSLRERKNYGSSGRHSLWRNWMASSKTQSRISW